MAYRINKKIGEAAYVVDLPKHMGIDSLFNILDLYSYTGEKVKEVFKNTKLEDELFWGENDAIINRKLIASLNGQKVCMGKVCY